MNEPQKFRATDIHGHLTTATGIIPSHENTPERWRSLNSRSHESLVPRVNGLSTFWQLSFANPDQHLGTCIVEASDLSAAVKKATTVGCNPGGEVLGVGFRALEINPLYINRLMEEEEVWNLPEWPGMEELPPNCGSYH